MKVEVTPAVRDLMTKMPDVDWSAWQGSTVQTAGWCPVLRPVKHDKLWLMRENFVIDLPKYMEWNGIQSEAEAATEIELRENRVDVVSSFEYPRVSNVREALLRVLQSFPLMVDALYQASPSSSWILWANIQFHLGEFDEEPDDVFNVRAEDLTCKSADWWFMAEVSFAKKRAGVAELLHERLSWGWGETLSPLQILCIQ